MRVTDSLEDAHQHFRNTADSTISYAEFAKFAGDRVPVLLADSEENKKESEAGYVRFRFSLMEGAWFAEHFGFLKFMFLPWPFAVISVSVLLGGILAVWSLHGAAQAGGPVSVALASVLLLASTFIHEAGHALAGSAHGARPGKVGVGFYLFVPVAFVDMTDVWRLTRQQRVITDLAGPCFEGLYALFLAAAGHLLANTTLVLVSFVLLTRVFFQLLPFFRTDGYWTLSDLLQVPDLSASGSRALTRVFQQAMKCHFRQIVTDLRASPGYAVFGFLNLACGGYFFWRAARLAFGFLSYGFTSLWTCISMGRLVPLQLTLGNIFGFFFAAFLLDAVWRMRRSFQKNNNTLRASEGVDRHDFRA